MSDLPICSVMMAIFQPTSHLRDQVISILQQQHINVELLISDDSDDSSLLINILADECVLSSFDNDSTVHLIDGPRSGVPSANFFSLVLKNSADARYYAFADQDDIWALNKISEAISLLERTDSDCYSSELSVWKQSLPLSSSYDTQRWRSKNGMFGFFFAESAGCTYVMSRNAFLSLQQRLKEIAGKNMLHLIFSHDLFTSAYLHSQSYKWFHDKRSFICYRQHQSNTWGANVASPNNLRKRLNLLLSPQYGNLLYLAWMGSAHGSIASQLLRSFTRLNLEDRIYLLAAIRKVVSLCSPKAIGLILFILTTRKGFAISAITAGFPR